MQTALARPTFLWLEITGRCQLTCVHCYADSGPAGAHGSMTAADWLRIIDEAADLGVRTVQFIGGEPTLHPALPELIAHALARTLAVEVFTNLVHVTEPLWQAFGRPGVTLATSYFSDDAGQHAAITGRPRHARTRANIAEALRRRIPLRAGVIDLGAGQRAEQARAQLADLGVTRIGYDRVRELGRADRGRPGQATQLCGRCGDGVAAVGPDGVVRPCVMSRWLGVGSVHDASLGSIAERLPDARSALGAQGMVAAAGPCGPSCEPTRTGENCHPHHCHPRF